MATGFIPLGGLNFEGLICYYGRESTTSSATWNNTVYGYARDYLSYSSGTFTVLKDFSADIVVYGKGSYRQDSGGSGRSVDYSFKKTSSGTTTTIVSGTVTATGSGTSSASVSFSAGDTFVMTVTIDGSGTCGTQCGFFMTATS